VQKRNQRTAANWPARADDNFSVSASKISIPKGSGALRDVDKELSATLVGGAGSIRGDQRWSTFPETHATAIRAFDYFVAVLARLSANCILQQLRELVGEDSSHRCLLYDRYSIFAKDLDELIKALGVKILKSPPPSPLVLGTRRRECLDWRIPLTESRLRKILRTSVDHYIGGRPHSSSDPDVSGVPT
jgi:hypothetical protein